MASIVPPNNNYGDLNTDTFAPVPWDEIQPTNNTIIDRNTMPFASTVEYKGYYKAESTGYHRFNLNGSEGVTGYSWLSSAPKNSDHIIQPDESPVDLLYNKSFGIIIPLNPDTGASWRYENTSVVGTFPGYGYFPKSGYGNLTKWNAIFGPGKYAQPDSSCGFSQTPHETFLPGDVRLFGDVYTNGDANSPAGPGWQGPEDPNFSNPCYLAGDPNYPTPLVRLRRKDIETDYDANATFKTPGKVSQISLDATYKAEGSTNDSWAIFKRVDQIEDHYYVWPQQVNVFVSGQGKTTPERVDINFALKMRLPTQSYHMEWKTKDGLKMWYILGGGSGKTFAKFPDTNGANPCNLGSNNTASTGWQPGGGQDSFSTIMEIPQDARIAFKGYAVGVENTQDSIQSTHGFSLVIRTLDSNGDPGDIVWTTEQLLSNAETGLVGIDECGYNGLLNNSQRIPNNRVSEFYKDDGWNGYSATDIFLADSQASDNTPRSYDTTRQYLWSNSLTRTRGGTTVSGSVYLRQGDYYFVRTIVSNNLNQPANFRFTVDSPTGLSQSVKFTGNGDPTSDTSVGSSAGGSGTLINTQLLCNSVLFNSNDNLAASNDTNFALVDKLGVVINLNAFNITNDMIGREGQAEVIDGETISGTASKTLRLLNADNDEVTVTISQLVRSGRDGIPEFSQEQIGAILYTYEQQQLNNLVLAYNTFRDAITSQAVISWGFGGNYPYIYHAVSEVIQSICDPNFTLSPTIRDQVSQNFAATEFSSAGGDSENIDVSIDIVEGGSGQITSEATDECKIPSEYAMQTSSYDKKISDFTSLESGYFDKVNVVSSYAFENWGSTYEQNGVQYNSQVKTNTGPIITSTVTTYEGGGFTFGGSSGSQGTPVTTTVENATAITLPPGIVTSIPITVPDVFYDGNWFLDSGVNLALSWGRIELDSNTFNYDPNNTGSAISPVQIWISLTPGGPAIGGIGKNATLSGRTTVFKWTASPNQYFDLFPTDDATYDSWGYIGNTNGVRYINIAPINRAMVYDGSSYANWQNIPDPGSSGFSAYLAETGISTDEIRLFQNYPIKPCN